MGNLDRSTIKSHNRNVSFNIQPEFENNVSGTLITDMSTGVSQPKILSSSASSNEAELLAKLEAANRELEQDQKSLSSLTPPKSSKGHSRQASVSSVTSNLSQCSNASNFDFEPANAEELWNLWSRIVSDWDNINKRKHQYVKDLVRRGIPHHFRGIVWQLLCRANDDPSRNKYADYLKQTSPMEKMIRRDITRTYPEHAFFKEKNGLGQESLFNVMKAYSLHDREVGYCQGSGFIVGLLLMQMPEEEAFSVLVKLMQDFNMRELFKPSMSELGLCMFQLEYLIQELLPQLHAHFQAQSLSVSMFASSWFLTVFTTTLSTPIVCRIFDVFLMEGTEYVFRVAMSILQLCEEHLLSLDMEGMIKLLSKESLQVNFEDPEQLLSTTSQIKFSSKKMKKLEKEYNTLKSKEQEEQVELRRLRTENRLLRQRIENLEKETATLADRLIHDQVKCAQQEETILSLKKDLSLASKQSSHLAEQCELLKRSSSNSSQASSEASLAEEDQNKLHRLHVEVKELKEKEIEQVQKNTQLNNRIKELENINQQLRTEPSTQLVSVQEELIACKLREAEANLSLKELQQKVFDLHKHWQKHMDKLNASSPNAKMTKADLRQMTDEIMSLRLREAQAVAQLKDTKQNFMEMETQNHISARQLKRLDVEKRNLEEKLNEEFSHEKLLQNSIQELERKLADFESKRKEDEMMTRIREAEHSQLVAEMRRRIAELEIENQELLTEGQIVERGEKGQLTNQIAELQDEVLQLKMSRKATNLPNFNVNNVSGETDTDYESDDLEATMRASNLKLCLTESMCGIELQNALSHPNELDTSDTDTPEQSHSKTRKKKKKNLRKDGIDLDKTPTQDNIGVECFLVDSSQLNDITNDTIGQPEKPLAQFPSVTDQLQSNSTDEHSHTSELDCTLTENHGNT